VEKSKGQKIDNITRAAGVRPKRGWLELFWECWLRGKKSGKQGLPPYRGGSKGEMKNEIPHIEGLFDHS